MDGFRKMSVKMPAVVSWLGAVAAFRGHEPLLAQPSLSPHGRHRHAARRVHTVVRKRSEGWEIRVGVRSPAGSGWLAQETQRGNLFGRKWQQMLHTLQHIRLSGSNTLRKQWCCRSSQRWARLPVKY